MGNHLFGHNQKHRLVDKHRERLLLGFFGLGAQPPIPELGSLVSEGRNYIRDSPASIVYPGLTLLVAVLSYNILGESLNVFSMSNK